MKSQQCISTKQINISLFLLISLVSFNLSAQNWDVPADKKVKSSSFKFDELSTKEGEVIYVKKCVSCHGTPAKGNMRRSFKPVPPDLASSGSQSLTDGELFYILNTGRGLMPSFAGVITETDQWKVISYLRSFNKSYKQVFSKPTSNHTKSK
jgi:mono/diheme cytochrome c family protein